VVKKLAADRDGERFRVRRAPTHTFASIGGLDGVIERIREVLDLALLYADVASKFRVEMPSGMTLVGPPGTGKTTLAGAIARYLEDSGRETHFLSVSPGDLRATLYGESEARIGRLFRYIRQLSGLIVLFIDEVESFGVREHGPGESIDARVLSALLVELDGIASVRNVFTIAATNRLDLCDDALVRGGRLGTIIEHVGRPDRKGARQILAKYLQADVPYGDAGEPTDVEQVLEAAASYLYSENKGPGVLATAVLGNAERREITARHLVSGALIKTAVDQAKRKAAIRGVRDGSSCGVRIADVLDAVDDALAGEVAKLKSVRSARRTLDFEDADQIARVEVPKRKRTPRHRYLSAA
jgi:SpoVK/Ycf46/Vps4 family AAA+-type ATPase